MNMSDRSGVIRFAEAQASIPGPAGERAVVVVRRGTLDLALAQPVVVNPQTPQTPHAQDEIYVIVRGGGVLIHDGRRDSFQSGDVLFLAAGCEHQLEDFTEDLALWRVFYGPRGGEVPE